MNSALYQEILSDIVQSTVFDLKLNNWVVQQDNDPKHKSKPTFKWLKRNRIMALERHSQSSDSNSIEILWQDLKQVLHA